MAIQKWGSRGLGKTLFVTHDRLSSPRRFSPKMERLRVSSDTDFTSRLSNASIDDTSENAECTPISIRVAISDGMW